jgi:hypothetical protein
MIHAKSGKWQTIGGYYALVIGLIIGLIVTPNLIKSIGAFDYGSYAKTVVNASLMYSLFPAVGRYVILSLDLNLRMISSTLVFGILLSIGIMLFVIPFFGIEELSILFLVFIIQFLLYVSDQIKAILQKLGLGKNVSTTVIVSRTVHISILFFCFVGITITQFILAAFVSELISVIVALWFLRKAIVVDVKLSYLSSLKNVLPYYFETNASKATSESFLKNLSHSFDPNQFALINIVYRVGEMAAKFLNVPINAFSVYFLVEDTDINPWKRKSVVIVLAVFLGGLITILSAPSITLILASFFNVSSSMTLEIFKLLVAAVVLGVTRPLLIVTMTKNHIWKHSMVVPAFELLLFLFIIQFDDNAIIYSGLIVYLSVFARGVYKKSHEVAVFSSVIISFLICALLL